MVARISDDYEPQFPVVGEDLPWPAARDVVASQVGAVRPLETVDQRIWQVGCDPDVSRDFRCQSRDLCCTGSVSGCVPKKAVEPLVLPVVAMTRSQAPALSEVCSLAVLVGGSLLRQTPWQW